MATPAFAGPYVVEFRARSGGFVGHTYVAYGEIDEAGRLHHVRYAGFYPSGFLSDSPFLAVLAAPGFVSLAPRDRRQRSDLVYRREISPQAYRRLSVEILALRRSRPLWHLTFYNCNSFAADVAQWLGLKAPSTLLLPKDFVRDLYVLNRRSAPGVVYAAATAPDSLFLRRPGEEPADR